MEKTKHKIVILADGDFPSHPVPMAALREADLVVCCDGAWHRWKEKNKEWGITAEVMVTGDGDSLSASERTALGDHYLISADQECNDQTKAMRYAVGRFSVEEAQYTILGATGKREDHTLGNISLLAHYLEAFPGVDVRMITNYGIFIPVRGTRTFRSFPRQQVSIVSMTPDEPVTLSGLQYPVEGRCLRQWWEGTLNAALGDEFTVSGGTLIVYQTHEAKN